MQNDKLIIFSPNSTGLNCKLDSLEQNVRELKAGAFIIQESMLYKKGQIKINVYQVFELLHTESKGGGLAIGLDESLEPVLISKGDDALHFLLEKLLHISSVAHIQP